VREGLSVSGSLIYNHPTDFARSIELVKRKVLLPSKIVTSIFPFNEMGQAMDLASSGNAGKVLVTLI
jgi:threonine dehydrogenase-like Zn-dependent dehydrogenase